MNWMQEVNEQMRREVVGESDDVALPTGWTENPGPYELLEQAWGLLANADGQSAEWEQWRTHFYDRWMGWVKREPKDEEAAAPQPETER